MSSYVCSYVVKKVTAHYRICVRASRQTQHETSCLEEPRGGKLLGAPKILPPLGRNLAAWSPGGGANFRRAKWAGKFCPPWGATGLPGGQGGG